MPTDQLTSFKVTSADVPDIEEGWYPADFIGVKPGPEGQYGPSISWMFTAYIEGEPEPVNGLTSTSTSIKGRAYEMLCGILGRQPEVDEEIDYASLKDKRVEVYVEPNKKEWPTVTKVRQPKKARG